MSGGPRLELVWPGKDRFLLSPRDPSGSPVWVDWTHPAASEVRTVEFVEAVGQVDDRDPYGDNLMFEGDSLDVLRLLAETPEFRAHYRGRVRQIYIDPPFNTGQTFEHYSDWLDHSTWLSFMRDRLALMRDLLAPDGSIWVHLDDAEVHRMRLLLDEAFGAQSFIAQVVWEKSDSPRNSARYLSVDQDYILIYAKDGEVWRPNRLPRTAESDAIYKNPDDDPRGVWLPGDPYANKPYSLGIYTVTGPTGRVFEPPPGRFWRISEEKFRELDGDGRIYWGPEGSARPSIKRYLSEVSELVPRTLWRHVDVGSNRTSNREMKDLYPGQVSFSTPKPERLLERVLTIGSNPGDIVLDCFGGSHTTAAVAQKMGRRWITAELNSETVEQFAIPRLTRVVEGTDPGGITKPIGWKGGGGFRVLQVNPSIYEVDGDLVLLTEDVVGERLAHSVAAQLGFTYTPDDPVFCGVRGRMRLAVRETPVGPEEVREIVAGLGERENVTIATTVILPCAEETLKELSKGSRLRKVPRDLTSDRRRRRVKETGAGK